MKGVSLPDKTRHESQINMLKSLQKMNGYSSSLIKIVSSFIQPNKSRNYAKILWNEMFKEIKKDNELRDKNIEHKYN